MDSRAGHVDPKSEIKILHFVESYGGGVATAVNQYISNAPFESHVLACVRKGDLSNQDVPTGQSFKITNSRLSWLIEWFRLRNHGYDIIHAHSSIAGLVSRLFPGRNKKIVYSPHAFAFVGIQNRLVRKLSRYVEKYLKSRTAYGAAVSNAELRDFIGLGYEESKVSLVPHAISVSKRVRQQPAVPLIVSIGRLSYQKNPTLMQALKDVCDANGGAPLNWIWIGDGDPRYRTALESVGISVTGWLPHEQVIGLISNATALFHPARYEGLPVSVLESLGSGTPVLASNIEPHREIKSTLIFKNVIDAAGILDRLSDSNTWIDWSRAGQLEVERKFSDAVQAESLTKIYAKLVHE